MRRLINRPDAPFTGFGRSARLALDPIVLLSAIFLMSLAVALPLGRTVQPFVLFAIVPVAVLRFRTTKSL